MAAPVVLPAPTTASACCIAGQEYPQTPVLLLVQAYFSGRGMGVRQRRSSGEAAGSGDVPIEEWPFLEYGVLVRSRSRRVCMTCHWFRHHSGVTCSPLLTCQLHQGLIAPGEHLVSRCHGWTEDLVRQQGWAPEVG